MKSLCRPIRAIHRGRCCSRNLGFLGHQAVRSLVELPLRAAADCIMPEGVEGA